MSDLIERLEGHIETLRDVASGVYSDDIQEAVVALELVTADRDRQQKSREHWIAQAGKLEAIVEEFDGLVANSRGVVGLHLNHDIAEWDWLLHNKWLDKFLDWQLPAGDSK